MMPIQRKGENAAPAGLPLNVDDTTNAPPLRAKTIEKKKRRFDHHGHNCKKKPTKLHWLVPR
jgi:hypothetical protein